MTKEVLKLALDALEAVNVNLVCQASHHKKTDGHGVYGICPNKNRHIAAIYAIKEALSEQPLDMVGQAEPKYKVTVIDDHHLAGVPLEQWGKQQAEPVAWTTMPDADDWTFISGSANPNGKLDGKWLPLYSTPPQRTWRGLTPEEIHQLDPLPHDTFNQQRLDFARAIETKLREKNA